MAKPTPYGGQRPPGSFQLRAAIGFAHPAIGPGNPGPTGAVGSWAGHGPPTFRACPLKVARHRVTAAPRRGPPEAAATHTARSHRPCSHGHRRRSSRHTTTRGHWPPAALQPRRAPARSHSAAVAPPRTPRSHSHRLCFARRCNHRPQVGPPSPREGCEATLATVWPACAQRPRHRAPGSRAPRARRKISRGNFSSRCRKITSAPWADVPLFFVHLRPTAPHVARRAPIAKQLGPWRGPREPQAPGSPSARFSGPQPR